MTDPFYQNRAAQMAANILAAQMQDLLMDQIHTYADGSASGELHGVRYTFRWDVTHQRAVLIDRFDPREGAVIMVLAA